MTAGARAAAAEDALGLPTYVRTLLGAVPRKAALALTLMLSVSLTEWVGLVLLVPLLALTGINVGDGVVGRLADGVADAMASFGLAPSVLTVLSLYLAVVTLRAFMYRALSLATVDLERSFLLYLRKRMYRAVVHARWLFFVRTRSSDFLHAVLGQCTTVSYATNVLLTLVSSVVIGLVYLGLAITLSPVMTLLAVSCGLTLVFLLRRGTRRARQHGGEMTRSNNRLLGALTEHLSGMKTVKSYAAEQRNITAFGALADAAADAYRASTRNAAGVKLWFEIGSTAALCALLYVAIEVMAHSTAEILLLLYLFARLVPRFSGIQQQYQSFVTAMPAFSIVMGLLQRCEEAAEPRLPARAGPLVLRHGVRLEAVGFRYASDEGEQTLHPMDLDVPARRTTAIVGPSGAGKSTVADLLMGLLAPDTGCILVDGAVLGPENMQAWREQIGYVPQDTFLFHDTVRGNLLWACPDAGEAELREALRLAAADAFVERLPQGLDTVIGDRGVLLSGGERQRIALARALLRRPALLILDEATSALDSENELHIQRAIEQLHGSITIVVITHRLSTIRRADTIHVLEGGCLVESGQWNALLARGGRFAALCRAQGIEEQPRTRATMAAR